MYLSVKRQKKTIKIRFYQKRVLFLQSLILNNKNYETKLCRCG